MTRPFVCAVFLCAVAGASCSRGSSVPPGAAASASPAREVRLAAVARAPLAESIQVSGTLAAEEQAVLSFKVTGRIEQILVDLGSRVAEGQPVAQLVTTDFALRVGQAEAALQQARARLGLDPAGSSDAVDPLTTSVVRQARAVLDEAQLSRERLQTFVTRGLSARSELDSAEAALKVAEGRYQDAIEEVRNRQALVAQRRSEFELARQQARDAVLTAPFGGMIRERTAAIGQYVGVGTPIATLVRVDPLRLRLDVPEREAPRVVRGQKVLVSVDGDPAVYEGTVQRLSPAIAEGSRTLLVEAEVPNRDARIRPGSFAKATIVVDADAPALLVPASSVVTFAGLDKVFVVADGKAVEKRIQVGRKSADRVEVLSGLGATDAVVVEPGALVGGQPVSVAR